MRVHIIGAGPTGLSLAWELLRFTPHDVIVYDKKSSAGGSWWEPTSQERNLHSHRIVFDRAYVNTKSLFQEMGLRWNTVFERSEGSFNKAVLSRLQSGDYFTLLKLAGKVLSNPKKYRRMSLKDAVGRLSSGGEEVLSNFPLIMDGVDWTRMTAWEFVKSFDYVALSTQYTQRVSGKVMCDHMQKAVEAAGGRFVFGVELQDVEYFPNGFIANFDKHPPVMDGLLVLCVDHAPARHLVKDNWGADAVDVLRGSTYGALNVLLDYASPVDPIDMYEATMGTRWKIIPSVLSDGHTVSCVIPLVTGEIETTPEDALVREVVSQLGLPPPVRGRVAWGSHWDGSKWTFSQSSGVLSPVRQLPFWGKSSVVAMCGMMSPHRTPFASIETSVEVSRKFCHETFATRTPLEPFLLTHLLWVLLIVLVLMLIK